MSGPLRVSFSDPVKSAEVRRMQDNIGVVVDALAAVPLFGAAQIVGVEFTAGALTVSIGHGLGRAWTNWVVTDRSANVTIWRSSTDNRERHLTLTASGAVTINVLVW